MKPITEEQMRANAKHFMAFVLFLILCWVLYLECSDNKTSPVQYNQVSTPAKYRPTQDEAAIIAQQFVKQQLKSPATADFPYGEYATVIVVDTYAVSGNVDAQNSFGAMLRGRYTCIMKFNGGDWANATNWTPLLVDVK